MGYDVKPMFHRFRQNGMNIVLDVNSGIVHVTDDVTYDILGVYDGGNAAAVHAAFDEKYGKEDVDDVLSDLDELVQKEQLLAPMDPNYRVVVEDKPIIKALCLNIAHDCNLRCQYCFAGQGGYGQWRMLMSFDVARRAVDFLIAHSGGRKHCEIDFFGGEPLMNWHVIQETVSYIRQQEKKHNKIIKLSLTTNGLLLDEEKTRYLTENHISLILSLDGRKEMHDRMRPGVQGEPTYDRILKNLQYCVEHRDGEEYYVRGTYTRYNLDFATDVTDIVDKGFPALSMEPVVGDASEAYAIQKEDLPQIFDEYEKLAKIFIEREEAGHPFFYFHFNMDLWRGPCLPKRLRGCGAGHEYLAVVPNGDMYPCHQFVGRDGYVIGNVYEGLKNMDMMKSFRENHVLSKSECVQCWARFYCSGGCHANNETYAGDIKKPFDITCEIQKKRIECALMIQAYNKIHHPQVMPVPGLKKQLAREASEEKDL